MPPSRLTVRTLLMSCVAAVALLGMGLSAAPAMAQARWEVISKDDGVTVSKKEIEGRDLAIFKGVTTIQASILDILAVLDDTPNNTQWMHKCVDSRILEQINDYERVVYNRTDAPWPVDDRDVVVRSKVTVNKEARTVVVNFWSVQHPKMGEVDDAVRMPTLKGHYHFKVIDKDKTRVEYQVDADPGGMLPDWLADSASEELPKFTLIGLRDRVKKTRGEAKNKAFVERWAREFGLEELLK